MKKIEDFLTTNKKGLEVYHYSRNGDDILNFDKYNDYLHIFDSVGVHVGSLASVNHLFNGWKNRGDSGGLIYPLILKNEKMVLKNDGSIMEEPEVHIFLKSIIEDVIKETGLSEYSHEIKPKIREKIWSAYDCIPYINSVEAKGEISYICPAESLSFKISPNIKTYGNDIECKNDILQEKIDELKTTTKVNLGKKRLLKLYHGSRTGQLRNPTINSKMHPSQIFGIFFTEDIKVAESYSGDSGVVYECYLNIKKPYNMSYEEIQSVKTSYQAMLLSEQLKKDGYDGIFLRSNTDYSITEYIAFDVSQILILNKFENKILENNKKIKVKI